MAHRAAISLGAQFLHVAAGPEAMQLAPMGLRMHGIKGALMAGLLFVLPERSSCDPLHALCPPSATCHGLSHFSLG